MAFSSSIYRVVDVTLTTDTAAYAPNDVLVATQSLFSASDFGGQPVKLQTLTVTDASVQTWAADLYFLDSNVTFGAANAVVTLSAANAGRIIGRHSIVAADFTGLVLSRAASYKNIGLILPGDTWLAAVLITGTPTFSATAIKLRMGFDL